jgi:hypothetical protein
LVEDDALLDLDEELDISVGNKRQGEAVHTAAISNRERLKHLIRCLERRTGDNTSKATLQAHAFRRFESCVRAEGMSELQAGKYVAEHFYGDERDNRKNANSSGFQWYRYRARALIVGYR